MADYGEAFYNQQSGGSYGSAQVVLAALREVLPFASACDVGCGAGTWVRALLELGLSEVMGVDGEYARPMLQVPVAHFTARDLRAPLVLDRQFDLALSMEVAEHLPPARSAGFVADLVRLAPAVLFSAAIPGQGGTAHINERWQEDWVAEFATHGYLPHDVLRPRIWQDRRVEVWYRQNALLFLKQGHPQEAAIQAAAQAVRMPASVVHPGMFPLGFNMDNKPLLLKFLYWSLARDMRRLFGGARSAG